MNWAKEFKQETRDSLEKPPYTFLNEKTFNMKDRLIACFNCKYKIVSYLPDPKCGICHASMATVTGVSE